MRERVAASVPFVRFRVERVLGTADLGGAEGKDRAVEALRPVLGPLPASALRDELLALAADRLDVVPAKLAEWLEQPARVDAGAGPHDRPGARRGAAAATGAHASSAPPRGRALVPRAVPRTAAGGPRRPVASWTSSRRSRRPRTGRAAQLLRDHLGEALHAPEGDDELARVLAELQVRAARATPTRAALEAERLRIELATLERQIADRPRRRSGRRRRARTAPRGAAVGDGARARGDARADEARGLRRLRSRPPNEYHGGALPGPPGCRARSGVAQWQSIRLLIEGLWVRVPPPESALGGAEDARPAPPPGPPGR